MFLRNANTRDPERLTARVLDTARTAGCRMETYRDGDTYHVDIDLPGVDPADIDVTTERNVLTVRATRKRAGRITRNAPATMGQRPAGECARQIVLSDSLDTDELQARYDDGVLTLSIPVLEPAARADLAEAA